MDSLDILRVVPSTYPEVVGGVGLHVHHLSRMQAEMGHNVTVLASDNGEHDKPRYERRAGYQLVRHRQLARPLNNSLIPSVAWSIDARLEQADIIHIHSHLYFSSLVSAVLARRNGETPVVVTNHGMTSQSAPDWIQRVYSPVARYVFETADRVFCYTETDVQRLRDRGIDVETAVIPNGIDVNRFTPDASAHWEELAADGGHPYLLFVGRLHPGKAVDNLLEAFSLIEDEIPHDVLVVGDGPDREELERQAIEEGLDDRVRFLGEVENDALPGLYADADAFVLPSLSEGMPRTVLEAMACGTPVVANELPQLESVLEDAGEIAPSTQPREFGEAIVRVVTGEERGERGARARERIENEFSWSETVEETTDVFEKLV